MATTVGMSYEVLDRMVLAVELVRQRLIRSTTALRNAGIRYAVIGGNAVAAWVAKVDPDAVRNTADVDLLLAADDLDAARVAMENAGFVYRHSAGIDFFLDGPDGKFRSAVHIIKAGEPVKSADLFPAPSLDESVPGDEFQLVTFEALVRMKLVANRIKDKTHLMDMIDVGLIDASWPAKYPEPLASRLQELLDNPDG
ncbi:MAG: hypothetical protein KF777_22275 [Planctomycetaceae bacterium]|nr:hypothetical protein [Planctomycetaceae bacterium]